MDTSLDDNVFADSRDGHVYKTVKIGTQTWMAENLAYLPLVSPIKNLSRTSPLYYVYGYDGSDLSTAKATATFETYGVLYNWPAAIIACPSGWHLPTYQEWDILTDYLTSQGFGFGGSGDKIAKSLASTSGWTECPTMGTIGSDLRSNNRSGFNALPGGYSGEYGFSQLGKSAYFWSASEANASGAWARVLFHTYVGVHHADHYKSDGHAVRCIKDQS